jgi:hypothetical protein
MRNNRVAASGALAIVFAAAVCLFLFPMAPKVHAQGTAAYTDFGTITTMGTCWAQECYILQTTAPYIDNGCGGTASQQYVTAPGAGGNNVMHGMLLSSMLAGKKVRLVVQGCWAGHPQIISVGVQP